MGKSEPVAFACTALDDRGMQQSRSSGAAPRVPYHHRYVTIMAGGVGSRFWPWSRVKKPKQLLPLAGKKVMLAETAARVRGLVPLQNILVVTSAGLRQEVARAVPWLPTGGIYGEPEGRNTAACIGWAALEVSHRNPDGVLAVLPADHVVSPRNKFRQAVDEAFSLAEGMRSLITLGVPPTGPATGYGYIEVGPRLVGTTGAYQVRGFTEKPTASRARRFLATGRYYWNSGIFAWRADRILEAISSHLPRLAAGLRKLERARRRGRIPQSALQKIYGQLEDISIDRGVMEKAHNVVMLPAEFSWSDVGSWNAVAAVWPVDKNGNSSHDPLVTVDAHRNVVATRGKPVALLGVDDLAVVDAGDALLVCRRDRAEEVKQLVDRLPAMCLRGLT